MQKKIITGLLVAFYTFSWAYMPCYSSFCSSDEAFDSMELSERALTAMNQAVAPAYQVGYFKFGGQMNVDIKPKTMQKSMPGEGEDYLALSNIALYSRVDLLDWVHGFVGASYYKVNKGQGNRNNNTGLILDDAYVRIANFDQIGFFVQAGRYYLPFGQYNRYRITPSLVQMLTETRADAAQIGFSHYQPWGGFTAAAYFSQGTVTRDANKIQGDINGGGVLSLRVKPYQNLVISLSGQYMHNMLNVNALTQAGMQPFSRSFLPNAQPNQFNVYQDRTAGMAGQLAIKYCDTQVFFHYVSAFKSSRDIMRLRLGGVNYFGAKPSAWEMGFVHEGSVRDYGYSLDASYQRSKDAAGLYVFNALPVNSHPFPQIRYVLGMTFFINPHASIRFQWGHNYLYKPGQGDNGTQGDDATVRLSLYL